MLHPKTNTHDRLFFIILLILSIEGFLAELSQLICSHQPIVALAGDDVILPCHLEPPIDSDSETVIWTRPDLDPKYVHYHQDGRLNFKNQNPSYYFRTRLFVTELPNGNVSMKISRVKLSDAGKYECHLPSMQKEASIQLSVGVVSTPVIEFVSNQSREVVLQCEAKGWYPEPEVFWLDAEGNLLSAGPTETVRGPDDLYTVSRRLTVEKSDSFTCRVQQKNINQTRETHFYVPGHFFTVQSLSQTDIIIIVIIVIITSSLIIFVSVFLLFIFIRWKKKQDHEDPEFKNQVKRDESNTGEISNFTEERKKLNRTVEEMERADQQRELQEEEIMTEQTSNAPN
ncbi:butyrophilin-like protein 2 [Larimichthys crocea]|uniref:butyrophilin-like protein 2 n=1 Tax=Larimichthys crocea TaxID=215358 RepID=UPI000F5FC2C4|nr:butyrophilin-like protein 2 [Larimichthys crocea]